MSEQNVFRREGEYWTIVYDGKTVRLRDSRGLCYLSILLRRCGEDIPSDELQDAAAQLSPGRAYRAGSAEHARLAVTKALKTAFRRIHAAHPTLGAHLDATVRRGNSCRYVPDPRYPIRWEE